MTITEIGQLKTKNRMLLEDSNKHDKGIYTQLFQPHIIIYIYIIVIIISHFNYRFL